MHAWGPEAETALAARLEDPTRPGGLPVPEVATIGAQVAATLATWHRVGVVHGAVSPATITVRPRGDGRLGARLAPPDRQAPVDPRYLAPEQRDGRPVGPAADVRALGVTLLDCLTGAPSPGDPPPTGPPGDLGSAWRYLLAAMLAASPADRPNAEHVARVLADVPDPGRPAGPAGQETSAPASRLLPDGGHAETRPVPPVRADLLGWWRRGRRRGPREPDVRR